MSFKVVLNRFYSLCLTKNQNNATVKPLIYRTINFRLFSGKQKDINIGKQSEQQKEEHSGPIVMVMVKDQNGKFLGVKTKAEAKLMAKKMSMYLIEDKAEKSKYPTFQLVSNKLLAKLDQNNTTQSDTSHTNPLDTTSHDLIDNKKSAKKVREIKRMAFSAKVNDNDLSIKIKQTKKWISKGTEVRVNINSRESDKNILENIFQRFEQEMKGVAKFAQKKITNSELKFSLLSTLDSKDHVIAEETTDKTGETSIDFDNLDPNKLLTDEFEELLKKK